jgi:transposase
VASCNPSQDATVLLLPPYSSHYNPIEELWSKFKDKLRGIGARTNEDLYQAVGPALDQVTVKDIQRLVLP